MQSFTLQRKEFPDNLYLSILCFFASFSLHFIERTCHWRRHSLLNKLIKLSEEDGWNGREDDCWWLPRTELEWNVLDYFPHFRLAHISGDVIYEPEFHFRINFGIFRNSLVSDSDKAKVFISVLFHYQVLSSAVR